MTTQAEYAAAVMEEWLSHSRELGKKPAKLEIAGEFDLHDLHYYIFRFKRSFFDCWRVAVCGGYEGDGLGHCGHICSEMEPYDPATAQEKCVAMVEKIRKYWMDRAKEQGEKGQSARRGGRILGEQQLSDQREIPRRGKGPSGPSAGGGARPDGGASRCGEAVCQNCGLLPENAECAGNLRVRHGVAAGKLYLHGDGYEERGSGHFKSYCYFYKMKVRGKEKSKRYYESNLNFVL